MNLNQKRKRNAKIILSAIFLVVFMTIFVAGCPLNIKDNPAAQSYTGYVYKTLVTAKQSYLMAKSTAIFAYNAKMINDAQRDTIIDLSEKFVKVYDTAVSALSSYEKIRTAEAGRELETALSEVASNLIKMVAYTDDITPKQKE